MEAVAGVRTAKELGYRVWVTDRDPTAPAVAHADQFLKASVYDPAETLTAVLEHPSRHEIDGVIAIACDAPATVAAVAQALSLPGHSPETALLATDKLLMKRRFEECGIPTPQFLEIDDLASLVSQLRASDGPMVLKPVDSRGSRGVLRLLPTMSGAALASAYDHSRAQSSSSQLILERWIDGSQLSTESVIWDDESVLVAVAERNYDKLAEIAPFVVENGGHTPSRLSPAIDDAVDDVVSRAAKALGVERGTVKGDVVVGKDGPVLIELAARLSGGYFCTHTIPRVYGVSIVAAALEIAVGIKPDMESLRAVPRCYQGNRYIFLREGVVREIHVDDSAVSHPDIAIFKLYVKEGDRINRISDHTQRSGVVMTFSDSREKAERVAEDAIAGVNVVIE